MNTRDNFISKCLFAQENILLVNMINSQSLTCVHFDSPRQSLTARSSLSPCHQLHAAVCLTHSWCSAPNEKPQPHPGMREPEHHRTALPS